MHCGYITTLRNLRPHPNADRLQLANCFGNTVIVGLDDAEGEIGCYFPADLQLSEEFATANNLLRRKDENGKEVGGYLDPNKRNIRAMMLRGEKSDGLFLPLAAFADFCNLDDLNIGMQITTLNGKLICQKYVPARKISNHSGGGNKLPKVRRNIAPQFSEHIDTLQYAYNRGEFKLGDCIEITLKMHGTSGRVGYLPILKEQPQSWIQKLLRRKAKENYEYGYVTGTRRVVIGDIEQDKDGGFYGSHDFRIEHAKKFEGKLMKGEQVYFEIVGFLPDGRPIMPACSNKKAKLDKDFVKTYGDTTTFSYGCNPKESEIYVYRMTLTNTDGYTVEYSPSQMRLRCEQMGIKCVPVLENFTIKEPDDWTGKEFAPADYVDTFIDNHIDGFDPIGMSHIREGVIIRILNRPDFKAFKAKNFSFKVLEGIIKDTAVEPDMEEDQDV